MKLWGMLSYWKSVKNWTWPCPFYSRRIDLDNENCVPHTKHRQADTSIRTKYIKHYINTTHNKQTHSQFSIPNTQQCSCVCCTFSIPFLSISFQLSSYYFTHTNTAPFFFSFHTLRVYSTGRYLLFLRRMHAST